MTIREALKQLFFFALSSMQLRSVLPGPNPNSFGGVCWHEGYFLGPTASPFRLMSPFPSHLAAELEDDPVPFTPRVASREPRVNGAGVERRLLREPTRSVQL